MINKDNESLQITLKKSDIQTLNKINESLNKRFNFNLTKSQVIQYLINNFEPSNKPIQKESKKDQAKPIKTANQETQKEPLNIATKSASLNEDLTEIKRKTSALKNAMNLTNEKMSETLQIPLSSFKRYLNGQRTPTGKNADILRKFYEKYGIK